MSSSALGTFLTACSDNQARSGKGPATQQLTVAILSTPSGFDPEFSVGLSAGPVIQAMNLGLNMWKQVASPGQPGAWDVAWNSGSYREATVPSLAESWTASRDGREYTFKLRPNILSHAGNPLTAADVRWRFDRAFGLGAVGSSLNGVMQLAEPDSVEVVDQATVKFHLEKPTPDFLLTMADTFRTMIMDSTEVKKHTTSSDPWAKDWIATHDAGFGPYKLESFDPGSQIVLSAFNDSYLKPKIGKLVFRVISDPGQTLGLLARGEIDVALNMPPTHLAALKQTKGVKVWSFPGQTMAATTLVTDFAPLDNPKVRQALSYAAPYEAILQNAYKGTATPTYGPVLSGAPGHNPALYPYKTDIARAKQLLAEAGHPRGFQTTLTYDSSDAVAQPVGVLLQSSFREIGVDLQLDAKPATEASASLTGGKAPMNWFNLGADQPDPAYLLDLFFKSKSGINWAHYSNSEVDKLIERISGTFDWDARIKEAQRAVQLVINDAAWLWLAQPGYHIAGRDSLTGVNWYGGDAIRWDLIE